MKGTVEVFLVPDDPAQVELAIAIDEPAAVVMAQVRVDIRPCPARSVAQSRTPEA
jgi:hypothetical protein